MPALTDGVLVVGGCGYVGHLIAPFWERTPGSPRAYTFDCRTCIDCPWDNAMPGDVLDLGSVFLAMRGRDAAVYLACGAMNDPQSLFEVGVQGFYNVLLAAKELSIPRVVLAGSMSVYDGWADRTIDNETEPPECDDPYGVVNVLAEDLGRHFARSYGMSVIALRIAQPKTEEDVAFTRLRKKNPNALPASRLTEAFLAAVALKGHSGFEAVHVTGDHRPDARIKLRKAKCLLGWEP